MNAEAKLDAFASLMDEVSTALADVVKLLQDREGDNAIVQALDDLASALKKREGANLAPIVQLLREIREAPPAVNVTVHPAVHFHSLLKDGGQIEMRQPAPAGGRDKVILLRYIPPGSREET